MRRRPTLPHTFAYSTIGPAGLNFRVRDGNGWNPRGKITARSASTQDPSTSLGISAGGSNAAMTPQIQQCAPRVRFYIVLRAKGPCTTEGPKPVKEREDETSQLNRLSFTS